MSDSLQDLENVENQMISQEEELPPPPPVDAVLYVLLSEDNLSASIMIEPPQNGGNPPTLVALERKLQESHVTYGIDRKVLKALADSPDYVNKVQVAAGVAPVDGIDGTYELLFRAVKDFKPVKRPDGSVDLYDLGIIENVRKGQVLCKITLPTNGTEGMTVTGQKLYPRNGREVPYLVGTNVELNSDGTEIISQINGHVELNGEKINVSDKFYVKGDIDTSTGNIKALCDIVISGRISPGFFVETEGNIEVGGSVESATLVSGGNVSIRSGISGSTIRCEGDFTAKFIQNSSVFAKGDIKAEYCMNCTVKCGKNLQLLGVFAKFIGGSCIAGMDITLRDIGSANDIKTKMEIGTDPAIIERQQELTKQIPIFEKQNSSLGPILELFKQLQAAGRMTPDKQERFDSARYSFESNQEYIEKGKKELAAINESLKRSGYGRIIVAGTVYPGTRLKIGDALYEVTEPVNHSSFYYDKGEVCITSIV